VIMQTWGLSACRLAISTCGCSACANLHQLLTIDGCVRTCAPRPRSGRLGKVTLGGGNKSGLFQVGRWSS